jgi:hypothetical protein
MDVDVEAVVHGAWREHDLDVARAIAAEWVHAAEPMGFEYLPGVFQAAFVQFVTGIRQEPHETQFMWALPSDADYMPMREFPPKVDASGEGKFMLMPREAVAALYRSRGW